MEEKRSGFEAFYDFEKFLHFFPSEKGAATLYGVQFTVGEIQKKKVEKSKNRKANIVKLRFHNSLFNNGLRNLSQSVSPHPEKAEPRLLQ